MNQPVPRPSWGRATGDSKAEAGDALHGLPTAVLRIARSMRLAATNQALSPSRLAVLIALDSEGPLTAGDLAARERVKPPTISPVLSTLRSSGLIDRISPTRDRRHVIFTITQRGRDTLEVQRKLADEWLVDRLTELDSQSLGLLKRAMPIIEKLTS
jgi:DNA-binding MarR family transcriptional regulator